MKDFAIRMDRIKGSAIRELFKLVADPDIISFGGGNPAISSFPAADIKRIANDVLDKDSNIILQYGGTEGYLPLKKAIIEKLLPQKCFTSALDEMLITTGSTQAMDLASKVFLNPGDTILVEAPTFLGALQTYNSYEANVIPIPMDDNGIIIEALEELIIKYNPKLIYCIPTFQNPTGKTLCEDRRKCIAELATKYDVIVLEDDPYSDLRYEGTHVPTIKSFDKQNKVMYLGSFSKIVAPGLRIGYAIGDSKIIRKMTIAKQSSDLHCSLLSQAIIARYLQEDLMPNHLKQINADYKLRRDAMLNAIEKYFPKSCKYTHPEGGLFIWGECAGNVEILDVFKRSVEEKRVAFVPGEHFFTEPEKHKNTFRLNFSAENCETITDGIKRLGDLLKDFE